jgi:hypothetical protein
MKPSLIHGILAFILMSRFEAGLMINAAGAAEQVDIIGAGNASCGLRTAARRDRHAGYAEAWVLGFLSAVGVTSSDKNPLRGVDAEAVWAWIDNYCRAHPLERLVESTEAFIIAHPY